MLRNDRSILAATRSELDTSTETWDETMIKVKSACEFSYRYASSASCSHVLSMLNKLEALYVGAHHVHKP